MSVIELIDKRLAELETSRIEVLKMLHAHDGGIGELRRLRALALEFMATEPKATEEAKDGQQAA